MAKKEEHERVRGPIEWNEEPIYGTPYRVERFDNDFIAKVIMSINFLKRSFSDHFA